MEWFKILTILIFVGVAFWAIDSLINRIADFYYDAIRRAQGIADE